MEAGTGLALMIAPAAVVEWLLGAAISPVGELLGRCFGIALLSLGVACLPGGQDLERGSPVVRAMLIYNALIASYLAYLGTAAHLGGVLLWPAIALHAVVAGLLVRLSRS